MLFPSVSLKLSRLSLILSALLLLTSGTLIFARWKSSESRLVQTPAQSPSSSNSEEQFEAELVTATPTGFEPAEITRPQGQFLLAVDNRSGLNDLDLYLERETEGRVNVALGRRGKLKWREILNLPPGRYFLRAANDATWRCTFTITPR